MRIAVTGGAGRLGREVILDLLARGDSVCSLDLQPHSDPGVQSLIVDASDFGQVSEVILGATDKYKSEFDAIVHLGAIPAPGRTTNAQTFARNTVATFNILQAATMAGIDNIVIASSELAMGVPFDETLPQVPIDESVPTQAKYVYALGKRVDEMVAAQFCDWHPSCKIAALRFSFITYGADGARQAAAQQDPSIRGGSFWTYIDVRDAVQAVRRALDARFQGFEPFIIANDTTLVDVPTAQLLARHYPHTQVTAPLGTFQTIFSNAKARTLLGFEPQHDWRQ